MNPDRNPTPTTGAAQLDPDGGTPCESSDPGHSVTSPYPGLLLFDAGFTDLVSVIPPGADLKPSSNISQSILGKVPGKKTPMGWRGYPFTRELPDRVEVARWADWGSNIGLLGNQYPALDLDVEDEHLGFALVDLAHRTLGSAPVRRSRGARRLLVYRSEEPLSRTAAKIRCEDTEHLIEFLGRGRQYLVHGTHPSGAVYRWEGPSLWKVSPSSLPLVDANTVMGFFEEAKDLLSSQCDSFELQGRARARSSTPPQEDLRAPSIEDLRRVVGLTPNPATWGWDEMIKMGFAIRAAGQEDKIEARDIFLEWCERWEGGSHDRDTDLRNWESFQGPFRVGWSWIQRQAQALGDYCPAQDEFEADPNATPPDPEAGDPRLRALRELNETYAVVQVGGDVAILQERRDGEVAYLSKSAFDLKLANRTVRNLQHPARTQKLSRAWLDWENRREYEEVVFKPGEEEEVPTEYNLWTGWGVSPSKEGSCQVFLEHLREVVCGGVQEHFDWLLDWMAHLFRYPQVKPGIAVALKGGQGAGKSIVGAVMKVLLGRHQVVADKASQVVGRFNAHLAHCLLLQAEEAFWGGSKADVGILKHLVTGETLRIERKGIDSVEMPNFTRLLITTNEDKVWQTDPDDRRLAIFEVSQERVGDSRYFQSMMEELERGGYQRLLHILQNRTLSSSRLPNPPTTTALLAQAAESMGPEELWLLDLLSRGEIEGELDVDGGVRVALSVLHESYSASLTTKFQRKSAPAFAHFLSQQLKAKKTGNRPRVRGTLGSKTRSTEYRLPPLDQARKHYSGRGRAAAREWEEPNEWVLLNEFGMRDEECEPLSADITSSGG